MDHNKVPQFIIFLCLLFGLCRCCDEMRIMVPAYFDPSFYPQGWTALNSAASLLPNRVVAIANPANGPGSTTQSSYANAFSSLRSNRGQIFGYVFTSYSNRAASAVKTDVDAWFSFYPGQISGIFFDEVVSSTGKESHYQDLYNYVKSKNSNATVVNNPGGPTEETYLIYQNSRVADVICTFENGNGGLELTQQSWTANYSRYNFYALFYNVTDINVSSFDYGDVIDRAYQQNYGWVYVTDDSLPNPWDTIPGYFVGGRLSEVQYIGDDNCETATW